MSIRRQDIGVLLFYFLGYSRIRNYIFRLRRKPVTRFVTFHDIEPAAVSNFESNITFLKQHTNVASFNDYMSGRLSTKKINAVITFDDGFKSWITHAVPILKKLALPATFFISSGFIDLLRDDEDAFVKTKLFLKTKTSGGLSSVDIKSIIDQGFTIGGHTLNHRILSTLHDKAQLRYEITEDKSNLERITGTNIMYFAYPSGAYYNWNINVADILREAGYKGAVTIIPGFNNNLTNPFLLHRELTGASMHPSVFKARILGNYDAIQWVKQIFKIHHRTKTS